MGKKSDNYIINKDNTIKAIKKISRNFGFVEINENLYLRNVENHPMVYMAYTGDYLAVFTKDTNITYSYDEIVEKISEGEYNERTFVYLALNYLENI
jgi:hypothetical protein